MLHKYEIEVNNSNNLKDNDMLNCSMELSLLNNLFRENLITEAEQQISSKLYCAFCGSLLTRRNWNANRSCEKAV